MHFYQGKYISFPSLVLFFLSRLLAFLSHSFTFFFFSAFLSSVHFCLFLILPWTHFFFFPLHCVSLFIYFDHSVLPSKKLFILQCIFFLCCTPSAIAHSQQDCRRDYNVSFQHYKSALLPSVSAPVSSGYLSSFISHSFRSF